MSTNNPTNLTVSINQNNQNNMKSENFTNWVKKWMKKMIERNDFLIWNLWIYKIL